MGITCSGWDVVTRSELVCKRQKKTESLEYLMGQRGKERGNSKTEIKAIISYCFRHLEFLK